MLAYVSVCSDVDGGAALGGVRVQAAPGDEDVEQRGLLRRVKDVEEALARESWLEAVQGFDEAWGLACEGDDPLLEQRGTEQRQLAAGESDVLAGGKARLESVYRGAGEEFRGLYGQQFNDTAARVLRGVLEQGDAAGLGKVASRYQWTPSGPLALRLRARMNIESGDFLEAGLLLTRAADVSQSADGVLRLQAAWCFAKAGLLADAGEMFAELRVGGELPIPPGDSGAAGLVRELESLLGGGSGGPAATRDWLQPLGDYRRLRPQQLASLRLSSAWSESLFELQDVLYAERMNPFLSRVGERVEQLWRQGLEQGGAATPAAQPLVAGGRVYVRTPVSIQSWSLGTGELIWEASRPDRSLKETIEELGEEDSRGAELMLADLIHRQSLRGVTGTQMSISGSTLFVVEETASSAGDFASVRGMIRGMPTVPTNYIRAYDVETGLFLWEIGGQTQNAVPGEPQRANLLAGYYFLGAPLVLGNRIYVLAENGEGIYLVRIGEPDAASGLSNPQILASQLLGVPELKLAEHPLRRHAGLVPTFARGLLICPTCDNRVTAVSAEDLSIRWIARYAGILQPEEIGDGRTIILFGAQNSLRSDAVDMESRWSDFLPRVIGGRVLITPRDSDQLYCLDVETGRQQWAAPRGGFHGIAGATSELVILAGRRQAGGVRVDSGKLAWTTTLPEGTVCGSGIFTGELLQLPTDTPSLVSLDVKEGRILAIQPWTAGSVPGNLLSLPEGTLVQGLTRIQWLPRVTEELRPMEQALQLVLGGDAAAGREVLEGYLREQPGDQSARLMLIDLMLGELRAGGAGAADLVPRLEELLRETAREGEMGAVFHAMLGMTLPDVAGLPVVLRTAGRRREEALREILLRRETEGAAGSSLDELRQRLRRMVLELPRAMQSAAAVAGLDRSQGDVLAAAIREGLLRREILERSRLRVELAEAAIEAASAMTGEQRLDFSMTLMRAGLPECAGAVLEKSGSDSSDAGGGDVRGLRAARELADLQALRERSLGRPERLQRLLSGWQTPNSAWQLWTLMRVLREQCAAVGEPPEVLEEELRGALSEGGRGLLNGGPASIWPAEIGVEVSDDLTMLNAAGVPGLIPVRPIPIFGDGGLYRGWSLVLAKPGNRIVAYDPDGQLRWTFQPDWPLDNYAVGYRLNAWGFAYGRLLVLYLQGVVAVLDMSAASGKPEPGLLWRTTPEHSSGVGVVEDPRDFLAPEERIEQYQLLPGGYFPLGPVSEFGVPVISGRRLQMLSLFTGARLWELDVVPADARLLLDGDRLLVFSDSARQTEVRSAVDGTLLNTHRLPAWWGEAGSNQGLSALEIDVEEGTETIWRVHAEGRRCVLFRLTAGGSRLECRDLLTDESTWGIGLPERTVVSNVADGVVALLSEGRELRIVNLLDGSVRVERELSPVVEPRKLYLRHSHGVYVVLPEALSEEDPSLDEFNPLLDAVRVHGRAYGIADGDGRLLWEHPVRHRQLRLEHCTQTRPLLSVFPLLVLLTRERDRTAAEFSVPVGAEILDVRTGRVLHQDANTGRTQNEIWLSAPLAGELLLSFDNRRVRFIGTPAGLEKK
jgi:outer membrane protein assembly factor BamB